ncbi:hypothetical protein H0A61_00176 [Koleobacter methoxysyntrophicus]|uniref:VanZ-like domain-containing protein n=1 Tax=Koleobacter methoxysyntrophicus TaxID=2751313 RepID=A0A8A0RJZ2_9FIRM|nr:VanZ family protein [Koleobacter methoxysyntrophicus]QSQ07859.1 hypothetical protein H0A61_00176 [Koleobacter methoxysyntrophicus]
MKDKEKVFAWVLVIVWMVVIFYFSHQPARVSAVLSYSICNFFKESFNVDDSLTASLHYLVRKGAHVAEYFVLAFLLANAFEKYPLRDKKVILYSFSASFLFAISDEIHQLYVPGREGRATDVIIDTIGIIAACVTWKMRLAARRAG